MHPKFALLRREWLSEADTFALKSLCTRPIKRGVQPEYDDSEIYAVKTGTLKNGWLDWEEAQSVSEDFFENMKRRAGLRRNDVLVSSTGVGSLGKVDIYERDEPALADGHISIVRINAENYEPALLIQLLRHRVVQWQIEQGLTGSTNQIDIYPNQIESLRVPRLDSDVRKKLLAKVTRIETEIANARAALRAPDDVIDEILCSEFNYPLAEHRERARIRHFTRTIGTMTAGFTLRNSAKFHHPDFELTEDFFARTPHCRIRNILARRPKLGAQISPSDFEDDSDQFYLTPAAIKSGRLNESALRSITDEFFQQHAWKLGLCRNDIILGASGEGMGKVGIFDSDRDAIFSQFIMRLRFNSEMNPDFACYFMRSVMFQTQIEREKRGTNIPNIFPTEVERMLVVNCVRQRQNELAARISTTLAALDIHRAAIESKRAEITKLIDEAIHVS
jgi:hypothetical protein